jgi:urease accessory protein
LRRGFGWRAAVAPLLATLAWAHPAAAHTVGNRFGDFYAGVVHPVTALEHALPILAMGLLAGQQGKGAARWLVLVFPLALLIGAGLAAAALPLPATGVLNGASFVVLGLLVAAALRLPLPVLIGLGLVFGISHGYENGRAMAADAAGYLFVLGVAAIGGLVTALVSAATDLPDTVYQESDVNFVYEEFGRLVGSEGRVVSHWNGPRETALYLYGRSAAAMLAGSARVSTPTRSATRPGSSRSPSTRYHKSVIREARGLEWTSALRHWKGAACWW